MEKKGFLIINTKINRNSFQKIQKKINQFKKILYFFILIIILINIGIIIFVFINIYRNSVNLTNLSNEKLLKLKNDLYKEISNLEEIMKLKEQKDNLNKISNNELLKTSSLNYEKNTQFEQNINYRYIKEQNNFCDNQNIFYNQEFEDKIKKADINFQDKKFNMYVYRKSDVVSQRIINSKKYESFQTKAMIDALNYYSKKKKIKNEDIYIIDIGANIGWYSFIFGKYGYKIISFEASEINNYILKKNYCLNKETNVTLINKGLYNEEKKCEIHVAIGNEGDGTIVCKENLNITKEFFKNKAGEIMLTKLSNYIPFLSEKNLVLIKMDVEGSEGKAIEGGIELITKYHVPFIFTEFARSFLKLHGTDPKQFLQLFEDNGYKLSFTNFFENYLSPDDILRNKISNNLYIVYSKILE